MSRHPNLILIFALLSITTLGSTIERIPFHILEARTFQGSKFNDMSAVQVSMSEDYYDANSLGTPGDRPFNTMLISLETNVSAIARISGDYFTAFTDEEKFDFGYDNSVSDSSMTSTIFWSGKKINDHELAIGNSSNPAWKLSTFSLYSPRIEDLRTIQTPDASESTTLRRFITSNKAQGFIGLGIGGEAANNFKGDHPLFSIQVNDTGAGSLIFGKDDTLYDSKRPSVSFPTDTNWTMQTKKMSFVPNTEKIDYTTKLVFDVNHPGISLPKSFFTGCFNDQLSRLNIKWDTKDKTYAIGDSYRFVYHGNITDLPDLTFEISENLNLTIPPQVYARKSETQENTWVMLFTYSEPFYQQIDGVKTPIETTILGLPFLASYYSVFEKLNDESPTVTLYPTYNTSTEAAAGDSGSGDVTPQPEPEPKPEEPEEPVDPSQPEPEPKPEDPVNPSKPEPEPKPEEPENPSQPEPKPEESVDPSKPEEPVDPSKPEEPVDPQPKPEEPVNPQPKPEGPVDPVKPQPEQPAPVNPEGPSAFSKYWYYLVFVAVIAFVVWKIRTQKAANQLEVDLESERGNDKRLIEAQL